MTGSADRCAVTTGARLADALAPLMRRLGIAGAVRDVRRLSGGANLESWFFGCADDGFVLRRAPSAEWMKERQIDLATEAQVIRRAHACGVATPEVVGELLPGDDLGIGFVMRALSGTADPRTVIAEAAPAMIGDLAAALAGIHTLDPAGLPLPQLDAAQGVERLVQHFEAFGGDRPIIALGLAWLRANLPEPRPPRLNHGDLRIGNVMADHGRNHRHSRLGARPSGDPHEDLAFGCMAVWRFGAIDRPAFGIADLDTFFAAYEAAGGAAVDRDRFHFWLVYRTVWWALGCLRMAHYWREGTDRSLERVVVGRRAAEQELDLLLLLGPDEPALLPSPPPSVAPQGEPSAEEMLTAVSEWLAETVKPKLEGRDRFNLAVAQNALGIVRREIASRPVAVDRDLAQAILGGGRNLTSEHLLARLRGAALRTVAADSPKYPSLAVALERWKQD